MEDFKLILGLETGPMMTQLGAVSAKVKTALGGIGKQAGAMGGKGMIGAVTGPTSGIAALSGEFDNMESSIKSAAGTYQKLNSIQDKSITSTAKHQWMLKKAKTNMDGLTNSTRKGGKGFHFLDQRVKQADDQMTIFWKNILKVGYWMVAIQAVFGFINAIKGGTHAIGEYDHSQFLLRKVMKGTTESVKEQMGVMHDYAKVISQETGASLSDITVVYRDFIQKGKTVNETLELTRAAMLAVNVTNLEVADAANFLTAAVNQFGLASSESMGILNSWNEVMKNVAASAKDLAESVGRSGAVFRQTGSDIHELNAVTAAMIKGTAESGHMVGRSIRMMGVRYLDLNRATSVYNTLLKHGIDITKNAKTEYDGMFKTLYDVHNIWGKLNEVEKAHIAVVSAGARHVTKYFAVMNSWDEVMKGLITSIGSVNSAVRENAVYMESLKGKTDKLSASWKTLFIEGGSEILPIMKELVDFFNDVVIGMGKVDAGTIKLIATIGLLSAALWLIPTHPVIAAIGGVIALLMNLVAAAGKSKVALLGLISVNEEYIRITREQIKGLDRWQESEKMILDFYEEHQDDVENTALVERALTSIIGKSNVDRVRSAQGWANKMIEYHKAIAESEQRLTADLKKYVSQRKQYRMEETKLGIMELQKQLSSKWEIFGWDIEELFPGGGKELKDFFNRELSMAMPSLPKLEFGTEGLLTEKSVEKLDKFSEIMKKLRDSLTDTDSTTEKFRFRLQQLIVSTDQLIISGSKLPSILATEEYNSLTDAINEWEEAIKNVDLVMQEMSIDMESLNSVILNNKLAFANAGIEYEKSISYYEDLDKELAIVRNGIEKYNKILEESGQWFEDKEKLKIYQQRNKLLEKELSIRQSLNKEYEKFKDVIKDSLKKLDAQPLFDYLKDEVTNAIVEGIVAGLKMRPIFDAIETFSRELFSSFSGLNTGGQISIPTPTKTAGFPTLSSSSKELTNWTDKIKLDLDPALKGATESTEKLTGKTDFMKIMNQKTGETFSFVGDMAESGIPIISQLAGVIGSIPTPVTMAIGAILSFGDIIKGVFDWIGGKGPSIEEIMKPIDEQLTKLPTSIKTSVQELIDGIEKVKWVSGGLFGLFKVSAASDEIERLKKSMEELNEWYDELATETELVGIDIARGAEKFDTYAERIDWVNQKVEEATQYFNGLGLEGDELNRALFELRKELYETAKVIDELLAPREQREEREDFIRKIRPGAVFDDVGEFFDDIDTVLSQFVDDSGDLEAIKNAFKSGNYELAYDLIQQIVDNIPEGGKRVGKELIDALQDAINRANITLPSAVSIWGAGPGGLLSGSDALRGQLAALKRDLDRAAGSMGGYAGSVQQVISGGWSWSDLASNMGVANAYSQDFAASLGDLVSAGHPYAQQLQEVYSLYYQVKKASQDLSGALRSEAEARGEAAETAREAAEQASYEAILANLQAKLHDYNLELQINSRIYDETGEKISFFNRILAEFSQKLNIEDIQQITDSLYELTSPFQVLQDNLSDLDYELSIMPDGINKATKEINTLKTLINTFEGMIDESIIRDLKSRLYRIEFQQNNDINVNVNVQDIFDWDMVAKRITKQMNRAGRAWSFIFLGATIIPLAIKFMSMFNGVIC